MRAIGILLACFCLLDLLLVSRNSFGANFVLKKRGREVRDSLVFLEGTEAPHIVYPVGKHIGIRNLNTNAMMIIKQSDEVKEVLSLTISTGGMRRYLAAVERQVHDNQLRVSIHDLKHVAAGQMKPPKIFNLSELAYGSGSRFGRAAGHGEGHAHGSAQKPVATLALPTGLFGLEKDKPDANQKMITSFTFSEDNKLFAFVITDQFPELKGGVESRVIVYDWSSKQKVVALCDLDYAV